MFYRNKIYRPQKISLIVCLGLSLFWPAIGCAEIYRWVDSNGKIHFSDRPTSDAAEKVEKPVAKPLYDSGSSAVQRNREHQQQRMLEMFEDQRKEKAQRITKDKQKAAERKRRCAYARDRRKLYKDRRIYEPQNDGSRRFLTDEERRQEVDRVERAVAHWCD